MKRADMVVSVSFSDACACVAEKDVLIDATGLFMSSPVPTIQSSAFLRTPGSPWAYSGVEKSTASDCCSWSLKSCTGSGLVSSMSGLKCGSSASLA